MSGITLKRSASVLRIVSLPASVRPTGSGPRASQKVASSVKCDTMRSTSRLLKAAEIAFISSGVAMSAFAAVTSGIRNLPRWLLPTIAGFSRPGKPTACRRRTGGLPGVARIAATCASRATPTTGPIRASVAAINGETPSVRLHHRRRRVGRLGHGQSAVGPQRQQGAAVRGRSGHAARAGAEGNRRQLFRHGLFRSAFPLDRTQGPYPGRQPQQSAREPPAAAQVRAGARAGRRLVDQRPDGQPRRADRLRRMGEPRRRRLGLERRAALFQEGRARPRLRRAAARQGRPHPGAPHPARATGRATPRRSARPSRRRASSTCPTRTASSSTAISRSPIPTPRSGASRRPWAISTPRRASAPTSRSRPTLRSSPCCSRARAASASTARIGGKEQEFRGREVILSSGAIHSPAHLMRAGIGPVGQLADLGIPVVAALARRRPAADGPSLDRALVLHQAAAPACANIRAGTSMSACATRRTCRAFPRATCSWRSPASRPGTRSASRSPRCSPSSTRPTPRPGQVKLASRDWRSEPIVEFNLLSDKRDLDRLMSGFKLMAALQMTDALRKVTDVPFPASYSDRVRADRRGQHQEQVADPARRHAARRSGGAAGAT